jgi:hypothetical protein
MEESFSEYWWRGKGHTLEFFTKFAQYLCCQPAERVLAHQPHQVNRIVATVCDEWDTKALTKSTSATADCKRSAGNQAPRDASIVSGKWHSPMPSRSRSRAQHYESDQHDLRNSVIDPKTEVSFSKIPDVVVANQVTTRAPDMSADRGEAVDHVAVR